MSRLGRSRTFFFRPPINCLMEANDGSSARKDIHFGGKLSEIHLRGNATLMQGKRCAFRSDENSRGLQSVHLENDLLSVEVLPQLGAKIWSFIHKPSGV